LPVWGKLGYAVGVSRPSAYEMFTTGCMMSAATAFRTGVGCLELWTESAPKLMKLGVESWEATPSSGKAQAEFRDEMIALARSSSEVALTELRRGVDDLDAFTRPEEGQTAQATRPYKAKQ
jgi:hypothetical protein